MPRILLVKTSSMGDVIHNLPVVSDILAAMTEAEIDWVVEESFAAIPRLHPGVRRVVPVALRRWRKRSWQRATWREIAAFARELRHVRYDAVVDTQGLLKSALLARAAHGRRYGLDWRSSREPLSMFYHRTLCVPRDLPAVERNRMLAARTLCYTHHPQVDFGIRADFERPPWLPHGAFAVLIHATSAPAKLWSEDRWITLGRALSERGIRSVLPYGDPAEEARSERLSTSISGSIVPAPLTLGALAGVLAQARYAIGVDTGLTHLAGALGAPTVGVYTSTDPHLTGLYGCARATNVGGRGASPDVDDVLHAAERLAR